jgi:type IV pilus assembly protein PilN
MIKINLLKQAKKGVSKKEITIYKQLIMGGVLVAAFLVVIVLMELNMRNKMSSARNNIAQLNQRLVQLNKVVSEINNFKKMKDQIKAKLDIITNLEKSRTAEVHLMDELSKSIPYDPSSILSKKLWLVSLQEHGDLIGMDGVALDNSTIAQFMDNLSKDPYFSDINLSKTEQIKSNDLLLYKFSLSCKFNPILANSMTGTTQKTLQ